MKYYHGVITEKSFKFLQQLKKRYKFILIGGWAVFLYSHSLKSKDIDIIIDYSELGRIKEEFNVSKNDRLKKYEIKTGEFDVDIYLPRYSQLGIEIDQIQKTAVLKDGFFTPPSEILFLLKLFAWQERQGSAKGKKDELDIFSLAALPEFNWQTYKKFVDDFNLSQRHILFLDLLKKTTSAKELGLNEQKLAKLKKKIYEQV